jgi:hypothetical protein
MLVGSRLGLLGPGEARPLACEAKHRGGGNTALLLLFPWENEAQKNAQKIPENPRRGTGQKTDGACTENMAQNRPRNTARKTPPQDTSNTLPYCTTCIGKDTHTENKSEAEPTRSNALSAAWGSAARGGGGGTGGGKDMVGITVCAS